MAQDSIDTLLPSISEKLSEARIVCFHHFIKNGFFVRSSDRVRVQKYICTKCGATYSEATHDLCRYQKKRYLNSVLYGLLSSGTSQRRAAYLLHVNYKTIVRKFLFIGQLSLKQLPLQNLNYPLVQNMEFDDLETFEHTKCKPLSVVLGVDKKSRRILGFSVSQMPAKGLLAKISVKKYGKRTDLRPEGWNGFFQSIKEFIHPKAEFKSDKNPHYNPLVKKHFANVTHVQFESRKGAVTGQGELKKVHFDPLFSINHTFAKLRADINRLFRRTWCTTKKPERLTLHIAMMATYHNHMLLKQSMCKKSKKRDHRKKEQISDSLFEQVFQPLLA